MFFHADNTTAGWQSHVKEAGRMKKRKMTESQIEFYILIVITLIYLISCFRYK